MANAYGVKFNDWVLVAAVGGVLYLLWASLGKGLSKVGNATGDTTQALADMFGSWFRYAEAPKGNISTTNNYTFQKDSTLSQNQRDNMTKKIKEDFPYVSSNPIGIPSGTYVDVAIPRTMSQYGNYLSQFAVVSSQSAAPASNTQNKSISTKTYTSSIASGSLGTTTYKNTSSFGSSKKVGAVVSKTNIVYSKALKSGSKKY